MDLEALRLMFRKELIADDLINRDHIRHQIVESRHETPQDNEAERLLAAQAIDLEHRYPDLEHVDGELFHDDFCRATWTVAMEIRRKGTPPTVERVVTTLAELGYSSGLIAAEVQALAELPYVHPCRLEPLVGRLRQAKQRRDAAARAERAIVMLVSNAWPLNEARTELSAALAALDE